MPPMPVASVAPSASLPGTYSGWLREPEPWAPPCHTEPWELASRQGDHRDLTFLPPASDFPALGSSICDSGRGASRVWLGVPVGLGGLQRAAPL